MKKINFRDMNKRAEVEGFMPMVLVKLIFALLLILLITGLLVLLWRAVFGSDNETEKDNFETLFKLIESKQKSTSEYESTRLTIYLETGYALTSDHTIHFFPANEPYLACSGVALFRPSDCKDNTKSCLCLYDSNPDRGPIDKDDDVIMCKEFQAPVDIDEIDFQLINNSEDCSRTFDGDYVNLIVGVHNVNNNKRVFVWINNDANAKLDAQMKKKTCPDTSGLCKDKKDSEIINDFTQVNAECKKQDPNKAYFEAKCTLGADKCNVECSGTDCSALSCEKLNIDEDYFVKGSKEEYFCQNKVCNLPCENHGIEQYTCITGKEKECKELLDDTTIPGFMNNCSVIIGPYSDFNPLKKNYQELNVYEAGDIIGFDDSNNKLQINCESTIEQYFKKYNTLVCVPGKSCTIFTVKNPTPPAEIQQMLNTCDINPVSIAGKVYITKYNPCPGLDEYFTPAYRCSIGTFKGGGGSFGGAGVSGSW